MFVVSVRVKDQSRRTGFIIQFDLNADLIRYIRSRSLSETYRASAESGAFARDLNPSSTLSPRGTVKRLPLFGVDASYRRPALNCDRVRIGKERLE
jgi:hypothetical protein